MAEDIQFTIKSDSPVNGELMFWSVVGHEGLSRPSVYELSVLSKNQQIDAKDILGRAFDVAIEFLDADGGKHERHCQGHAVRFMRTSQRGALLRVPHPAALLVLAADQAQNSWIQQDKPVLDVLDAVFEDSPVKRFKKVKSENVIGTHNARRYCVQYQESDYAFLSRLLEDEGIYYWFDAHEAPGTMHLADSSDVAHQKLPVTDTLNMGRRRRGRRALQRDHALDQRRRFDTGKHSHRATATSRPSRRSWAPTWTPPTRTSWPTSRSSSSPAATSAATMPTRRPRSAAKSWWRGATANGR